MMDSTPGSAAVKDFFISYTQMDRVSGEWIAWRLEEVGYTTILQAWDFRPGSNFPLEMDRASQEATRTLAILSPAYLESIFTRAEWVAAFRDNPTGSERRLIPLRVEPCELKGLLGSVVYLDLVGLEEDEAARALLDGLREGRAKPEVAPLFPRKSRSVPVRPAFPVAQHSGLPGRPPTFGRADEVTMVVANATADPPLPTIVLGTWLPFAWEESGTALVS